MTKWHWKVRPMPTFSIHYLWQEASSDWMKVTIDLSDLPLVM